MAFCFECATLIHSDDVRTHVCNPADLPVKGELKRLATVKQVEDATLGLVRQ